MKPSKRQRRSELEGRLALHQQGDRNDRRTASIRDRDRIIYSAFLRRLGDTTQISRRTEQFGFNSSDTYQLQNRLTHSLRAASVAESVAYGLKNKATPIDATTCFAGALAHDLGLPPYGHIGEQTLDEILRKRGLYYEANAQTFRVVTKLARREPALGGLDLTRGTLAACVKAPYLGDKVGRRPGIYDTEREDFEFVNEIDLPTIEGRIVDFSDDVSYAIHDLTDFFLLGVFTFEEFLKADPTSYLTRLPDGLENFSSLPVSEAFSSLSKILAKYAPLTPAAANDGPPLEGLMSVLTSELVSRWKSGLSLESRALHIDPIVVAELSIVKSFVFERVIKRSASLAIEQELGRWQISYAFEFFERLVQAETEWGRLPHALFQFLLIGTEDYKDLEGSLDLVRSRAVADFIASMTEGELTRWIRQLAPNPVPGR